MGQCGMNALAHFCMWNDRGNSVVRGNLHPDVEYGVVLASDQAGDFVRPVARPDCDAEYHDTTCKDTGGDECSARPFTH